MMVSGDQSVRWSLFGQLHQPPMAMMSVEPLLEYSETLCLGTVCPPQTPHDLTWARTRAVAVGASN
jgi:hypothetical protein